MRFYVIEGFAEARRGADYPGKDRTTRGKRVKAVQKDVDRNVRTYNKLVTTGGDADKEYRAGARAWRAQSMTHRRRDARRYGRGVFKGKLPS